MAKLLKATQLESIVFHVLRVMLIVTLSTAVLFTFLYWAYYMNIVYGQLMGVQSLTAREFYGTNLQAVADAIPRVANDLAWNVFKALAAIGAVVVLLLLLPRVRKYHKGLIATAVAVMVFCAGATLACNPIVNQYARKLVYSHNLHPGD